MYVHLPCLLQATRCEQLQVPEVPASRPLHLPVHRQTEVPTETIQDTDVEETEASATENVSEGAKCVFNLCMCGQRLDWEGNTASSEVMCVSLLSFMSTPISSVKR